MTATIKKLWKNEYLQTSIVVLLIVTIVFGFWFGSQIVLNTKITPALAVVSGSMCIPYDGACDGWTSVSHPFERTLHKGDIIIIQGINPKDLNVNYPNSDVIVYRRPDNPDELIVHRIVAATTIDGKLYFYTKGDGNNPPDTWPNPVPPDNYDKWYNSNPVIPRGTISEDLVLGKVVMRIPWIGWVAIFTQWVIERLNLKDSNIAIPIIIILIILLLIVEFVVPLLKRKETQPEQKAKTEPQTQSYLGD